MSGNISNAFSGPEHHVVYESKSQPKPPGAVLLTSSQVNTLITKTIDNWQPSREMYVFFSHSVTLSC
jgi:hypothetical protein